MVRYMQHLWLKLALNNYKAVNLHDKNAFADSITNIKSAKQRWSRRKHTTNVTSNVAN